MKRVLTVLLPEMMIILGICASACAWNYFRAEPETYGSSFPPSGRQVDCGACSLYVICKIVGREQSLEYLRGLTKTSNLGTNMFNLKEAAEIIGFDTEGCQLSFSALHQELAYHGKYAILHSQHDHFVAVVGTAGADRIRLLDNVLGIQDLSEEDVNRIYHWDGATLLLRPL
jgi:ATP-binding cassette subfamily B protein